MLWFSCVFLCVPCIPLIWNNLCLFFFILFLFLFLQDSSVSCAPIENPWKDYHMNWKSLNSKMSLRWKVVPGHSQFEKESFTLEAHFSPTILQTFSKPVKNSTALLNTVVWLTGRFAETSWLNSLINSINQVLWHFEPDQIHQSETCLCLNWPIRDLPVFKLANQHEGRGHWDSHQGSDCREWSGGQVQYDPEVLQRHFHKRL